MKRKLGLIGCWRKRTIWNWELFVHWTFKLVAFIELSFFDVLLEFAFFNRVLDDF